LLLAGKRVLITGVLTEGSIAYHSAKVCLEQGADVVLTGFGRGMRLTQRTAKRLSDDLEVLELDITDEQQMASVVAYIDEKWGSIDGVLHSIGFAPADALGGNFLHTPPESAQTAFMVSAFSLKTLAVAFMPLMEKAGGGSVVTLDFDNTMAWPTYDWMGVAKSALVSIVRYLARDLGTKKIRVNAVSAGPLATVAAKSVPGFMALKGAWDERSPLEWDTSDPEPVANMVAFLFSDLSTMTTGDQLHVDGGLHAVAAGMPKD
jgi:enoyl ACP reductase